MVVETKKRKRSPALVFSYKDLIPETPNIRGLTCPEPPDTGQVDAISRGWLHWHGGERGFHESPSLSDMLPLKAGVVSPVASRRNLGFSRLQALLW